VNKVKVLFQGESITDAGRRYEDPQSLGEGYVYYAAQALKERYPQTQFEFVNLGINGHQTKDLLERIQKDFVDVQPDVLSIMIGVNDVWHHAGERDWIDNDLFEARYREILEIVKSKTCAKIMMMEPFLIPVPDKQYFREDLAPKIEIIRKLARQYADVYLPTDGLAQSVIIGREATDFASDGVHPTPWGAQCIGAWYADFMGKIL
jgi:lysophospholipase L1-like esterase